MRTIITFLTEENIWALTSNSLCLEVNYYSSKHCIKWKEILRISLFEVSIIIKIFVYFNFSSKTKNYLLHRRSVFEYIIYYFYLLITIFHLIYYNNLEFDAINNLNAPILLHIAIFQILYLFYEKFIFWTRTPDCIHYLSNNTRNIYMYNLHSVLDAHSQ